MAPSSPPSPSDGAEMWLIPPSNDRIVPHATPVPTMTAAATAAAVTRTTRLAPLAARVFTSDGIWSGYLRGGREPGNARPACQTRWMSETLVISGAGGQVGRFLADEARRRGLQVRALSSSEWDITDPAAAERFIEKGDVVINCAAYTAVDAAEGDPETAHAVNVVGAQNVAHACARADAQLIHISTDYVFSGEFDSGPRPYEPDDETGPLSVYGRTKLAGELSVLAAMPDAKVVRTAWVYTGGAGGDFVATMARKAAQGEPVDVVNDQVGSPTYVADLVNALLHLTDFRVRESILHAANSGGATRFEQAKAVFEGMGADPALVRPVSSAADPRPAARPRYSVLAAGMSGDAGLPPLRPWRDALNEALRAHSLPSTP